MPIRTVRRAMLASPALLVLLTSSNPVAAAAPVEVTAKHRPARLVRTSGTELQQEAHVHVPGSRPLDFAASVALVLLALSAMAGARARAHAQRRC